MSNYLERVAMSAAGHGPRARPPVSGPPLPVGMPAQPTPQEIDLESLENPAPAAPHAPRNLTEPKPRSAEPRRGPMPPPPPAATSSTPARPDRISFPAFAPNTIIRIPKTLRPSEPPPAIAPQTVVASPVPASRPAGRAPTPPSRTPDEARIEAATRPPEPPPLTSQITPAAAPTPTTITSFATPHPPAPPPPVAVTPAAAPERRAKLHIGHLDLQVINTPSVRPEARPAKASTSNSFLESRLLERSWFRL